MIPLERLNAVRTIVTHADCADGVASAMILRDALPGRPIRFLHYETKETRELAAEPGMLFCDFTPPRERVQEFVAAGAIVLDHHRQAKDVVEAFGELGVFADEDLAPGVSGAVLAFRHVWRPLRAADVGSSLVFAVERFAQLAGIRDTWLPAHGLWPDACAQAAALTFTPFEELDSSLHYYVTYWREEFGALGRIVLRRKARDVKRAVASAYRFTTPEGLRVIVFEGLTLTSDAAELLGDEVDLVAGFGFTVGDGAPQVIVSMRSHTTFDCGAFARSHGGGGHTRAAGFPLPLHASTPHPYQLVRDLFWAASW